MPEQAHHPRIGMQNGQALFVRKADGREAQTVRDERESVQLRSLPALAGGL